MYSVCKGPCAADQGTPSSHTCSQVQCSSGLSLLSLWMQERCGVYLPEYKTCLHIGLEMNLTKKLWTDINLNTNLRKKALGSEINIVALRFVCYQHFFLFSVLLFHLLHLIDQVFHLQHTET